MNELVKLAIDAHNGSVEKYSVRDAQDTLRQALIEANGGSTKMDIRAIRDGKCNGVFALVEEILKNTIPQGFEDNAFFNSLVEYRNYAEGDSPVFEIEDDTLFFVDEVAKGTQGIRRQRLAGLKEVTIPTTVKAIRIYEELSRILAGRADFNEMIDKVSASVQQKILAEVYALWANATATDLGGSVYFPAVGSYSETALLDIIEHVEAAAGGKGATIIGTKAALRNLMNGITAPAEVAKEDMYNNGYLGKFYGAPVIAIPQRHELGGTNFLYDDKTITVLATGDKPIKFIYNGDPLILARDAANNMDLTQEYFLAEQWGSGIVMNANTGIGKYTIQ